MENHPSRNPFTFVYLFTDALCRFLFELSKVHSSIDLASNLNHNPHHILLNDFPPGENNFEWVEEMTS